MRKKQPVKQVANANKITTPSITQLSSTFLLRRLHTANMVRTSNQHLITHSQTFSTRFRIIFLPYNFQHSYIRVLIKISFFMRVHLYRSYIYVNIQSRHFTHLSYERTPPPLSPPMPSNFGPSPQLSSTTYASPKCKQKLPMKTKQMRLTTQRMAFSIQRINARVKYYRYLHNIIP